MDNGYYPEREGRRKKRFEAAVNMQPADLPAAWRWGRRKDVMWRQKMNYL